MIVAFVLLCVFGAMLGIMDKDGISVWPALGCVAAIIAAYVVTAGMPGGD